VFECEIDFVSSGDRNVSVSRDSLWYLIVGNDRRKLHRGEISRLFARVFDSLTESKHATAAWRNQIFIPVQYFMACLYNRASEACNCHQLDLDDFFKKLADLSAHFHTLQQPDTDLCASSARIHSQGLVACAPPADEQLDSNSEHEIDVHVQDLHHDATASDAGAIGNCNAPAERSVSSSGSESSAPAKRARTGDRHESNESDSDSDLCDSGDAASAADPAAGTAARGTTPSVNVQALDFNALTAALMNNVDTVSVTQ